MEKIIQLTDKNNSRTKFMISPSSFVKLYFDIKWEEMKAMITSLSPSDPSYIVYRAICHDYDPSLSFAERMVWIRKALMDPPKDLGLFILLLRTSVYLASQCNLIDEAQRTLDLMKQISVKKLDPYLQTCIFEAQWHIAGSTRAYPDQLEPLSQALEVLPKSKTPTWRWIKAKQIRSALENEDFALAIKELEELKPCPYPISNEVSYNFLYLWYLSSCGKTAEAYGLLKNDPKRMFTGTANWLRFRIFLYSDHLDEAALELPKIPFKKDSLLGYLALAKRDLQTARLYGEKSLHITASMHPRHYVEAQQFMASLELASGNARSCRVILSQLDPHECKLSCSGEWLRLHMLEGNHEKAVEQFHKINEKGIPELIRNKLHFAHELTYPQWKKLCEKQTTDTPRNTKSASVSFPPKNNLSQPEQLIGSSPAMQELRDRIPKLSRLQSPILIEGEAGTGKELVSNLIHNSSPTADQPFFSVNCISSSSLLVESQLFGHVKSTFPSNHKKDEGLLVKAGRGTVVLKEIDLGSVLLQNQILRLIEEGHICPVGSSVPQKVKARLIINSAVDLKETLRKDLYYTLERVHIKIPPLRERPEDILLLARYFLQKHFHQFDMALGEDLIEVMRSYLWPGNVEELEEEIKRMAMISKGSQLLRASLFRPLSFHQTSSSVPSKTTRLMNREILEPQERTLKMPMKMPTEEAPKSQQSPAPIFEILGHEYSKRSRYIKHTMTRQKAVLELFDQHEKITPANVVKLLHCSLTTASKDLSFLENKGFIRRVLTSAHIRTSYYVKAEVSSEKEMTPRG